LSYERHPCFYPSKSRGPWPQTWLYSKALEETIFFCEDEDTKAVLASAGAEPFSIYTKDELQILVAHNRTAPLTAEAVQAP
jgi:hypothetical protein